MKRLLIGLVTASMLLTGPAALAGGKHGHGGYHRPPIHGGYYRPHHHHHYRDYSGAYLLGGIALGAVLTDAFVSRSPSVVYVEPSPPARVIYRERPVTTVVVQESERSLLRDLSGNCYEVRTDDNGNELRTQVSSSQCDW